MDALNSWGCCESWMIILVPNTLLAQSYSLPSLVLANATPSRDTPLLSPAPCWIFIHPSRPGHSLLTLPVGLKSSSLFFLWNSFLNYSGCTSDVSRSCAHIIDFHATMEELLGMGEWIYLWIPPQYLAEHLTYDSYSVKVKFERIFKKILASRYVFIIEKRKRKSNIIFLTHESTT